jgi:hypothetical protein
MENEFMKLNGGRLGIKRIINEKRIFPKTFGQCGRFSFKEFVKEYVAGKGIIVRNIEYEVYYFCRHKAYPENFGGTCMNNNCVCDSCIDMCAVCGRYLCLVPGCCNPIIIDGKISCPEHWGRQKFLGIF